MPELCSSVTLTLEERIVNLQSSVHDTIKSVKSLYSLKNEAEKKFPCLYAVIDADKYKLSTQLSAPNATPLYFASLLLQF